MPSMPPNHRTPRANLSEQRGSASSRGYGTIWRRLRLDFLRDNPLCAKCQEQGLVVPAAHVDHVLAREHGGTDDEVNLMPLCQSCHSRKTVRVEQGGKVGARRVSKSARNLSGKVDRSPLQ